MSASDPATIVFPLRSNARSLLAGSAVGSVRRRLKVASLLFDRILLEAGHVSIQAGPSGQTTIWRPTEPGERPLWQTPIERRVARQNPFVLLVGVEDTPGVPAERMIPLVQSETSVRWEATLEPFRAEFTAECHWLEWVHSSDPIGVAGRLVKDWSGRDERNQALSAAIPERFLRSSVVQHANRDLVAAMSNGFLASQDNLHLQVLAQRFEDSHADWRLTGYALPILIPDVGDLGWDELHDLRRDKSIQQLRGVLNEIEQETMDVAVSGGDLERAVHRAAEKRLTRVAGTLDTIGALGRRTAIDFVVGAGAGVATMGLAGPVAALASSGLGSVGGAVLDGLALVRNRRAKQWVGMLNRLRQ